MIYWYRTTYDGCVIKHSGEGLPPGVDIGDGRSRPPTEDEAAAWLAERKRINEESAAAEWEARRVWNEAMYAARDQERRITRTGRSQ